MVDQVKIDILRKIQEYRDKKIIPEFEVLERDGFERGILRVMVQEELLNLNGIVFSITSFGEEVLRNYVVADSFMVFDKELMKNAMKFSQESMKSVMIAKEYMKEMAWSIEGIMKSFDNSSIKLAFEGLKHQSDLLNNIIKSQDWANRIALPDMSPLIKASKILNNMSIMKISHIDITPLIIKESSKDFKEIIIEANEDKDAVYNLTAYEFLFKLERSLRDLIKERIYTPYEKQINNKINSDLTTKWRERKDEEDSNSYIPKGDYHLIEYSDFSELKQIFEKRNNKDLFKDLITDEEFKVILSKLHELEPIRKKIAHSRLLSEREFEMIKMYSDQIFKMLYKIN